MFFNQKNNLKNKGVYLVLLFELVMLSSLHAQFSVGLKAGVNMNQFTMPGSTIGVNAGAFGVYKVTPFLAARLELLYTQEGGGLRDYFLPAGYYYGAGDYLGNVTSVSYINPYVYMHSIQIPVIAELTLPEFEEAMVQPVLLLGASYGYMFQANELHTTRYYFNNGTSANVPYIREDARADFKSSQWGVLAGMGLKFTSEKRNFYFDVRYRQGLNQLNQIQYSLKPRDGRLYSSTLSINLSVSILKF